MRFLPQVFPAFGRSGALLALFIYVLSLTGFPGQIRASGPRPIEDLKYVVEGDERYADFKQLSRFFGLKHTGHWQGSVTLENDLYLMEFEKGSRKLLVNGALVWLTVPSFQVGRKWGLAEVDVGTILVPLFRPTEALTNVGHQVVVLDPGHGGLDTGGVGAGGLQEKEVALMLAQKVRQTLEAAGLTVVLTREDDRDLTLEERTAFAAEKKGDLFVSIHINAAENTEARGVETFVLPPPGYHSTSSREEHKPEVVTHSGNLYDGANFLLGFLVHQELMHGYSGALDRGLRQARYVVLREAPCPAVLVECGFISNTEEEGVMNTPDYYKSVARAISLGILDYLQCVREAALTNSMDKAAEPDGAGEARKGKK